mgnify:CR=1 FL=1
MSAIPLLITEVKFKMLLPKLSPDEIKVWVESFRTACEKYKINTANRVASFVGNCLHESQHFTRLEENLNYTSVARLLKIFPKDFRDAADAQNYVGKPKEIANRVYANQGGNGNEASGDGWRFRGRGPGQLTLRSNYDRYSKFSGKDFISNPDAILEPENLVDSFAWFFKEKKLHDYADKWDIKTINKKINGGNIGMEERIVLCDKVLKVLLYEKLS